jgi:transposase-like protein
MPAERTTMRHVRELLRLKLGAGLRVREIARRVGVAPSTMRQTLARFEGAGLAWPLPEGLTDVALEAALYPPAGSRQAAAAAPNPTGRRSTASSGAST